MFTDFFHGFYYSCLVIAAIISIIFFKKNDKSFSILCVLIVFAVIIEFIARYFSIQHKRNAILYLMFTPVEYTMYAWIFKQFFNKKKWTNILQITVFFLILFEIANIVILKSVGDFRVDSQGKLIPDYLDDASTNTTNIESVLLVFLSLQLFIKIKETPIYENIIHEGIFWFNCIVLFYYSFNILIWGFHGVVYGLPNPPKVIYNFLRIFSSLLYIGYSACILLNYHGNKMRLSKNA